MTAAVASVSAETLEDRPVANIGQALQGMVPGLNISIEGGDPNKVPNLNIRGATTFRQRGSSNDDKNKFDVVSGSPLISRKTKCSAFTKHFVPKSHLLTQFKM